MFTRMTNTTDQRPLILSRLAPPDQTAISKVKLNRRYTNGQQPNPLNESQLALLSEDIQYTLNICRQVVEIPANRCKVRSVEAQPANGASQTEKDLIEQVNTALNKVWMQNRMDERSADLHFAAGRDADAYLIADYDDKKKRVRYTINFAHDGDAGVYGVYDDDPHTPAYFVKEWREKVDRFLTSERSIRRRTLYFENRIERWIQDEKRGAGWQPLDPNKIERVELADGGFYTTTVVWWTDTGTAQGEPLGFPVFHYRVNSDGTANGVSDLAEIVPDVQDGINLANAMVSAAEQLQGTPLWVMFTKAQMTDQNGEPIELEWFPGSYVVIPDNDSSIGSFPAADLDKLNSSLDAKIRRAATLSNIPPYLFNLSGQIAAEGTQQQMEIMLLAKVARRQVTFGNRYEDLARMTLKLLAIFDKSFNLLGSGAEAIRRIDDLIITCDWHPAEIRDQQADTDRAVSVVEKLGIHEEVGQEIANLTPEQIEKSKSLKGEAATTEQITVNQMLAIWAEIVGQQNGQSANGATPDRTEQQPANEQQQASGSDVRNQPVPEPAAVG